MLHRHKRTEDFRILNRIIGPWLGRILESHLGLPPFFITFHPTRWALQYYSGVTPDDPQASRIIEEVIHSFPRLNRREDIQELDELVEWIATRPAEIRRLDSRSLFDAATSLLNANELRLGWESRNGATVKDRGGHWRLEQVEPAPLRWFQKILDLAFLHNFNKDSLTASEREVFDFEGKIVHVYQYMSAKGLVNSSSFKSYFAEYLYSQRGELQMPRSGQVFPLDKYPSRLDHFFLPFTGLGQWRAAACWVTSAEAWKESPRVIDKGLHSSIDFLFSQILVDAFTENLDFALIRRLEQADSENLGIYNTFASLWWSREVAFFQGSNCVGCLLRDAEGSLKPVDTRSSTLKPLPAREFLTTHWSPDFSTLQLDLQKLEGVDEEIRAEMLGFDRILFSVPLFDGQSESTVKSVDAARLQERLALSLRLYSLQRRATRVHIVEAVGHGMKNTVKITGWRQALQRLQRLPKPRSAEIEEAIRCLSLYELVEGSGGLLRLVSLCSQGQFEKIKDWTSPEDLELWFTTVTTDPKMLLARYVDYIERFFSVICYGLDWRSGFRLTVIHGEDVRERFVDTNEPPEGSVKTWIREVQALPPFSGSLGSDAHIALLSTLSEPVCNAVKTLLEEPGGLYVRITSDFPQGQICVDIGNDTSERPQMMPPSVSQASELYRFTYLATISEPPRESVPEGPYWIRVTLHPVQLASKILKV